MKRNIMLALCALLFGLGATAQENFYVIDGQHVEHFDGSQLVGKKIKHYDLKYIPDSKMTIHNISTTDGGEKIEDAKVCSRVSVFTKEQAEALGLLQEGGKMKTSIRNPLIIVDGEEYAGSIRDLTDSIAYIDVYKPGEETARSYGEKGKNGVVKIFTRKKSVDVSYYINGEKSDKSGLSRLAPHAVRDIKILKRGTAQAIKACAEGKDHDVYLVRTK